MNAYVWQGLDTGAYHKDGTAVVIAKSITQARKLLADADPGEDSWGYKYGAAASKTEPEVFKLDSPTVLSRYEGC